MNITILGRPASKKNNRRNFKNISLPSKAYERFEREALPQLWGKILKPIAVPVFVSYVFHQKGNYKQDLDNAISSVCDVLQEAGILQDDTLIEMISAQKIMGAKEWSTEIHIEEIIK